MRVVRSGIGGMRGERGFTLPELVAAIAILGILLAIAIIVLLGLLERWRVEAATNQLVADLRLAHTRATNQLTDWRLVAVFGREEQDEGPDYYLVRLAEPYGDGGSAPIVAERRPRYFPGNVQMMNVRTTTGFLTDDQGAGWWAAPWAAHEPSSGHTRTLEFNSDGTMRYPKGPNGSLCVSVDTEPRNRVVSLSATSRIRVDYGTDRTCQEPPY